MSSPYGRRPSRAGGNLPAPLRWLLRLNPLQSWLVVMAVIIGLSVIGLKPLAIVVAVAWSAFAIYTWLSPSLKHRLAQLRRTYLK